MRLVFVLWLVMIAVIMAISTVPIGHPCLKPVIIRHENASGSGGQVIDYRTSVSFQEPFVPPYEYHGVSPDGQYQFIREFDATPYEIHVRSTQSDEIWLAFISFHYVTPFWSADSRKLYIYEYNYQDENHAPVRMFILDVETRENIQEFLPAPRAAFQSPDARFLFVTLRNDSDDGYQLASIDTNTGETTLFDTGLSRWNVHWSPDGEWMVLPHVDNRHFLVINPQTGDRHPVINEPVRGVFREWTENSLWFSQTINERPEIWRVSLDDNSLHMEYHDGYLRWISNDDQWAYVSLLHNTLNGSFLYDTVAQAPNYELNIRDVDFSSDSRCMVARVVNFDGFAARSDTVIYDLQTMQPVFVRENVSNAFTHDWYPGDR